MGVCAEAFPIDRLFPQGANSDANDISIGHLSTPVPNVLATPVPIATIEPSNTNLTDVAYGCVTRTANQGEGIKRFRTYFYSGQTTQYYCAGDSGGPTFVGGLSDNGPIARIVSGYTYFGIDVGADPIANLTALNTMVAAMNAGTGISYRPQMQNLGFRSAAAFNGGMIGSDTMGNRLEGVQIWSPEAPNVVPMYQAYVQNSGWQGYVQDGVLAGTVGQGLRMEAFEMFLTVQGEWSDVEYRAFVHGIGWQPWITGNWSCSQNSDCPTNLCAPDGFCAAGTTGQSRAIEAMEIMVFQS